MSRPKEFGAVGEFAVATGSSFLLSLGFKVPTRLKRFSSWPVNAICDVKRKHTSLKALFETPRRGRFGTGHLCQSKNTVNNAQL